MLNILIIYNDHVMYKRMVNCIMQYVKNVRLCGISYSVKEATEIAKKQKLDIIILDYDMPNRVADTFLNFVAENQNCKNVQTILLADNSKMVNPNMHTYRVLSKPIDIKQLIIIIREIADNKATTRQNDVKSKIYNELGKLKYNFSYIGTKYMAEAIYEIYSKNYIYYGGNLNKNVYPIIAQRYHTNINTVKCNITAATKIMTEKCPKELIENYLFCDETEKPKVKEIMYKVVNKL